MTARTQELDHVKGEMVKMKKILLLLTATAVIFALIALMIDNAEKVFGSK